MSRVSDKDFIGSAKNAAALTEEEKEAIRNLEQAAVERAYEIAKRVLTEPSTIPETVVFQAEFSQGTGVYKYQDGIYFCYAEEVN